ncbi:transcriptional regulator [Actinosynnema sp. CS-041913]|uniref:transcriptional regulator n=1 Tax=Actinosynnema sp. CS-041913 TaxID=3239917 RepID=UPI003D89BDDE
MAVRDSFRRVAREAGYDSDYALAEAMGVDRSTVQRVLDGRMRPGNRFIAAALATLGPRRFNQLFWIK